MRNASLRPCLFALALVLSMILFLSHAQAAGSPKYGGVLKLGFGGHAVISLGYPPSMSGAQDGQQSEGCLETLLRYDEKMNLVPRLATEWSVAPDAGSITIKLRKGVKFHDGSDFNAEVVKWNIDQFVASPRQEIDAVSSVDIVDDYTVKLNFSQYNCTILNMLAADAGRMISKKSFDANGKEWCEKHPVGTGPFKFESWEKDVGIKLTRFDQYWQPGRPYLDGYEKRYFADSTAAMMVFKNGEIDMLSTRSQYARELEAEGKYNIVQYKVGFQHGIAGDSLHADSPFADIRVRQAMTHALDLPILCDALGHGYWQPLTQIAAPQLPGYNPEAGGYPYDPEKAKKLLAAAGYAKGFDTTLSFLAMGPDNTEWFTAVQAYLGEVGIRVKLNPLQRSAYHHMVTGGGWEGLCNVLIMPKPEVLEPMQELLTPGSIKFPSIKYQDAYVQQFLKASHATNKEDQVALTKTLMKMEVDDCPITWLWNQANIVVKWPHVKDDQFSVIYGHYISPDAWLDK